jgi:hypothetical protein
MFLGTMSNGQIFKIFYVPIQFVEMLLKAVGYREQENINHGKNKLASGIFDFQPLYPRSDAMVFPEWHNQSGVPEQVSALTVVLQLGIDPHGCTSIDVSWSHMVYGNSTVAILEFKKTWPEQKSWQRPRRLRIQGLLRSLRDIAQSKGLRRNGMGS